ncbi:GATA zinc finger domain-containing protein 14-like isoform X2 [Planococcus citri]|uniref:GATA zinc finger domain-containing protein 14-like isoform X2 n=1 Tax=Planococcus citri TaxID=170843 RepID=UPI0031F763D5
MASFRKSGVNRPQKSSFINGSPTDTKFKTRPGVIVPNRVFVGGICPSATENDLLSLFGKYGTVKAVKIISDQNGASKGYGFVTYEKSDDVTRLQNDAKSLMFNDRRLNIAPAVMKNDFHSQNPQFVGRFADSYVVPVTPSNIYFANNIPYQYQESTSVFPNSPYAPPLTVLPAVSDGAYYQNGYSSSPNFVPTTPYQGAALFYPVPHNTSPVMVGPQAYNSSYPSVSVSNSNYVYSSPAPATSSPPSASAKTSTAPVPSTVTNTSEVHGAHGGGGGSQVVQTSVPPPLPYPIAHPPQYYNGSVAAPPYSGEVYYNMVQGACYPVMTVNGHDAYIPYYDVPDTCNSNVAPEENNYDAQNYHEITPNVQNYIAELNNKDTSPPTSSAVINTESKQMMPVIVPQSNSDHVQEQYVSAEANNVANAQVVTQVPVPVSATPQTPVVTGRTPHANTDYNNPSNYMQHRNATAIIYQNTPVPPNNMYYNPIYLTEATTPALTQSPYPKNLSEHYVSDHLPKRDSKYSQKKFSTSPQSKDNAISIPNIPKFPFTEYINNNFPGFVNRNVKEKDYKNGNTKINDNKIPPRPPRSSSNGSTGLKPRVFHNQNQFTAGAGMPPPPRNTHRNGNGVPIQGNVPYPRSSSAGAMRPMHDQIRHAYDYQNSYQGQNSYQKYNYEKKNLSNGGGYHRVKYEKTNGGQLPVNHNNNNTSIANNNNNSTVTNANETYSKNSISPAEDVTKKPIQTELDTGVKTNNNNTTTTNECPTPSEQNSINSSGSCGNTGLANNVPVPVTENVQNQQQQQQQQVCQEMQNLAL